MLGSTEFISADMKENIKGSLKSLQDDDDEDPKKEVTVTSEFRLTYMDWLIYSCESFSRCSVFTI